MIIHSCNCSISFKIFISYNLFSFSEFRNCKILKKNVNINNYNVFETLLKRLRPASTWTKFWIKHHNSIYAFIDNLMRQSNTRRFPLCLFFDASRKIFKTIHTVLGAEMTGTGNQGRWFYANCIKPQKPQNKVCDA